MAYGRFGLMVWAVLVLSTGCSPPGRCDIELVSHHESAHATYAVLTGVQLSVILVSRDDELVRCPGEGDRVQGCGVICYEGASYGGGVNALWQNCALSKAGRHGASISLGFKENAARHRTDDKDAAGSAEAILEQRGLGNPWLPSWPTELAEDDEPTAADILTECNRHSYELLRDNKDLLVRLGNALEAETDGRMTGEEAVEVLSR
jgi:hypothetical protein